MMSHDFPRCAAFRLKRFSTPRIKEFGKNRAAPGRYCAFDRRCNCVAPLFARRTLKILRRPTD
jgi:hypothetical protein